MTTHLTDTLDAALERLLAGESLPTTLARHPGQAEALIFLLNTAAALEALRPVEMPEPEALLADRNDFLAEITRLQRQPVSPGPLIRLQEWIAHHVPWQTSSPTLQRKEQRRMSTLLLKATLIFGMIFGSAGGAVALAADSLPGSPLYPAKLATEQVRLNMTSDPAEQAGLHLVLARVRTQEIERIALDGGVPDEVTLTRLQMHLNQALHLAAGLPDDDMLGLLTQARQMIQTREQALRQTQTRAAEPAQEPLRQAIRLLNQARQEVELGLGDPQTFRWRHTTGRPPEAPPQPTMIPTPGGVITPTTPITSPHHVGPCPGGNCEPAGDQHQYGPGPEQPGPGGPGGNPDETCIDCQPVGDQNQYGPQPEQPGPGAPGGNPDGTCTDCEPAGDQNQYGPQPEQPGPGAPGGNPDGTCTDCQPAGDEHHNGPQPEPSGQNNGGETTSSTSPSSGQGNGQSDGGGKGGGKH